MKSKMYFLIFILFFSDISIFAKDDNKIVWLQYNRPPWTIPDGKYKNQGYADHIRQYLIQKYLQDYSHTLLPINPSRAMRIAQEKEFNICFGPTFKVKLLKPLFHFSKPIYVLPKGKIIVTKQTHKKLNYVDEISMEELIQKQNYTFGYIKGINFYPMNLEKYLDNKNVFTISTSSPVVNLMKMMEKNRIDWIYDFNVFIKWEAFLNKRYENLFTTIRVKETKKFPSAIAYIACSKNNFGQKIIDTINHNLTKEDILNMRKEVRRWQLDDSTTKEFEALNKNLFGY